MRSAWEIMRWMMNEGGSVELTDNDERLLREGQYAIDGLVSQGLLCRDEDRLWIRPSLMLALLSGGSA